METLQRGSKSGKEQNKISKIFYELLYNESVTVILGSLIYSPYLLSSVLCGKQDKDPWLLKLTVSQKKKDNWPQRNRQETITAGE